MIRMLLEDMLAELGCTIAAEATHIKDALEAVRNAAFDVAILDVNLGGEPISPVADALAARGTPFVFATGYGERALPESHRERPTLKKPFQLEHLKHTLETALGATLLYGRQRRSTPPSARHSGALASRSCRLAGEPEKSIAPGGETEPPAIATAGAVVMDSGLRSRRPCSDGA